MVLTMSLKIKNRHRLKRREIKKIIDELYRSFKQKIGSGVEITIKEVKEIPKDKNINFVRIVISKIKKQ